MRMVYISSPLRGDIQNNIDRANEYCAYAASCGVLPFAPHTIFTNYLDDTQPEQREQGLAMGVELLKRCDELWVMGSMVSEGMQNEIDFAKENAIPILYVPDEYVQSGFRIRQEDKPFSYHDCIPGSEQENYEGQILVLNHKVYADSESATADDSLWLAHGGFGCTYGARGRSILSENLITGEKMRWNRTDFHGVVDPMRLFSWMCDKPIRNEKAEETIKTAADILSDYSMDEEEEMEADM